MAGDKLIVTQGDQYPQYLLQIFDEETGRPIDLSNKHVLFKFRETGDTTVLFTVQATSVGFDNLGLCMVTLPFYGLAVDYGSHQAEICTVTTRTTGVITDISKASPMVITSTGHGLATGDVVVLSSVAGMLQANGRTGAVTVLTNDTFSLAVDATAFTAYASGGQWAIYSGTQTVPYVTKFKVREEF
jgi:hypothetical protein